MPTPTAAVGAPAVGATPATAAAKPAANRALGLGEVRNPEPFTLEQRLLDAVRRNDRATIARALELGATVHAKDDLGRSALFLAVLDANDLELVRWLHDKGARIDDPDVSKRTPLSFAADIGSLAIVRYLVENGAVVDARDFQQRTPLAHAAGAGHPDVIAFLAEHGADVNVRDQFGDTPLIVACAKGNAAAAAVLLQRGADPSLEDQEGRTAKERSAPEADPCRSLPQ
jgi:ankyrin repeat protein